MGNLGGDLETPHPTSDADTALTNGSVMSHECEKCVCGGSMVR